MFKTIIQQIGSNIIELKGKTQIGAVDAEITTPYAVLSNATEYTHTTHGSIPKNVKVITLCDSNPTNLIILKDKIINLFITELISEEYDYEHEVDMHIYIIKIK